MKAPGILEGITLAIGASVAGGVLAALLPILFSEYASAQILIVGLGLGYNYFIMNVETSKNQLTLSADYQYSGLLVFMGVYF